MGIELILLSVLVLLASMVGTLSGFGTSTIMVPVMLLFFPLPVTLLFVGIIHWFGDIWKMLFFRSGVRKWRLILWFAVPGVIVSYLGATVVISAPEEIMMRILGGFFLLYVLFIFFNKEWKLPERDLTAGIGGTLSGLAAGIFGVGGAIRGAFLSAFNLPKEVYLFTSGAMALVIDSSRIVGYVGGGTRLEGLFWWGLLIFIPLSFLGAWIAKKLVDYIPQHYFRIFIALFLAVVAVKFLLFP
jgi:hypothetical protein